MNKLAVFTMDVEAFSDTECLKKIDFNAFDEMFDGINQYLDLLKKYNIKANFFVVANSIKNAKNLLLKAVEDGHYIGVHGLNHTPPLLLKTEEFKEQIKQAIDIISNELNTKVYGHRSPCFSINEERIDILKELGLNYDSSFLDFPYTYYNGHLSLKKFTKIDNNIYLKDGFYEFCLPTYKRFPIGGGGYLRIAPWWYTKHLLKQYLKKESLYIFYLHPFEISKKKIPNINGLKGYNKMYLSFNKNKRYIKRIEKIIKILIKEGFEFTTFEKIIESKKK